MSGCTETDRPLVSVVVPVYQAERYLPACVDSLLAQTYDALEILLVDDGSPDDCGALCDAYAARDARVRALHQENRGVSAARNAGTRAARGAYIAFVDADDWVEPDYIEYLLRLLLEQRADIAVCRCETDPGPQGPETMTLSGEEGLRALLYQKLFDAGPWSKLYRADIPRAVPFPEGMFFEDLAVTCRMFGQARRVAYSRRAVYHYRQTPEGTMGGRHVARLLDEGKAAEMMYAYVTSEHPALTQAAACRRFSACCQALLKLPEDGWETERAALWATIRRDRRRVLTDREARGKNRAAALISYFGERAMRGIWKRVS